MRRVKILRPVRYRNLGNSAVIRTATFAFCIGAGLACLGAWPVLAEPTQTERVQAALDAWLAERAPVEK